VEKIFTCILNENLVIRIGPEWNEKALKEPRT
jgi:hypothetical protein